LSIVHLDNYVRLADMCLFVCGIINALIASSGICNLVAVMLIIG